jgi:rRNA maturation endonuclease Nob1
MFVSEEKKNAILTDYANPEIKVKDIEKKYGVNSSKIADLVEQSGGQLRTCRRPQLTKVKCPNCHRTIEGKGFKFCPYCGKDIRSEKDLTLEKIAKLFSCCGYLPQNMRDDAQSLIKEIEAYIRKDN